MENRIEKLLINRAVDQLYASIEEGHSLRRRMDSEDCPYHLYDTMKRQIYKMKLRLRLIIKIAESNPKYFMFKHNDRTVISIIKHAANTIHLFQSWNRGCRALDILIGK